MSNLTKLNQIWKSLNEETDVPRETSDKKDSDVKEDASIEVTATVATVSTSATKKSLYGDKKDYVLYKDTNSKDVSDVSREMGSKDAIKDFKVSNSKMETDNPVEREMGSKDAIKDFKVSNSKMETDNPVEREMGSKDAVKEYLAEYKSNVNSIFKNIKESYKI